MQAVADGDRLVAHMIASFWSNFVMIALARMTPAAG
jgi:hypothetical protein